MIDFLKKLLKKDSNIPANENTESPSIRYKNNDSRLENEHKELLLKNKRLYSLLEDLANYTKSQLSKHVTITMIYRTDAEQDFLYKNDEKYKIKKFKSPHQSWQAIDIRSSDYNDIEIKKIENYLNEKYNKSNVYKWTARNHTVGHGFHFHIQYLSK